jgi:hypothetical protein
VLVAALGLPAAEVRDVELVAVRLCHLPERIGKVELGAVEQAEVVGEVHVSPRIPRLTLRLSGRHTI